jgi:DsbC/DsbD-like thiol-disulfide interchange protein
MHRRQLLHAGLALPFMGSGLRAAQPNFNVKLLDGGWLGGRRAAGLAIELDDGWKTYWRMPGDAGIPPLFKWQGSANAAAIDVLFPLPKRYTDASGDTVGYKEKVILPILIAPGDAAQPIDLKLDLFFAVCEDICIPAKTKAALMLDVSDKGEETHMFQEWIAHVPVPATEPLPVTASTLAMEVDRPVLILSLLKPVTDIFVETDGDAYFRKPDFAADGLSARLVIDNVKDGDKLRGKVLNLTIDRDGAGLEQQITLA